MRRFVSLRNTFTNKKKQSTLCSAYLRYIIQQSPSLSHLVSTQLILLIASYIFGPINEKWLKHNENLKVFPCAKPKGHVPSGIIYYREIGVDEMDGPYWSSDVFKVDVTYYYRTDIYSVSLEAILSEKNQFNLHEYIAYNQWKYSKHFVTYWQSICHPIQLPIPRGVVLFVHDENPKYIYVSWLPTLSQRYCYPGYEQKVAICGGKQIDIDYNYNIECWDGLHYVSDVIWYIELGEKYDIVTTSTSTQQIIVAIERHQIQYLKEKIIQEQQKRSQQSLQVGLKRIYRNLRLNKYGELYSFGHQYTGNEWDEYLEHELNANNIHFISKGDTKKWTMLIGEATIIFGWNYFTRSYDTPDKDIVYLCKMQFQFNKKTGWLRIKAIRLKRNINGDVDGLFLLGENEKHYFSLLSVVGDNILYYMLDFLNPIELTVLQEVSMEFGILCLSKLKNVTYSKLWRDLNL